MDKSNVAPQVEVEVLGMWQDLQIPLTLQCYRLASIVGKEKQRSPMNEIGGRFEDSCRLRMGKIRLKSANLE